MRTDRGLKRRQEQGYSVMVGMKVEMTGLGLRALFRPRFLERPEVRGASVNRPECSQCCQCAHSGRSDCSNALIVIVVRTRRAASVGMIDPRGPDGHWAGPLAGTGLWMMLDCPEKRERRSQVGWSGVSLGQSIPRVYGMVDDVSATSVIVTACAS